MDADGYVHLSQEPGLGYRIIWDYIEENRIEA
jgi:L-alanine-DL-glutamate epimerase-like enolase superfamily enzyme